MRLRLNDWRTRFGEEDVVRVEKTKEKRLVLRRTGFFVVFFVSPSVFHLPLQRVRVLQGRQANNGDQETTNSVDSTQKKEQRQKCEDRWRRVVVVVVCSSTTTTRKTKKGENGWFGRLRRSTVRSGVVCVLVFFKKMDDEREIVWRRNERGGSKFLPAIRGSAVGVRRRHVETNELRVWICFFA